MKFRIGAATIITGLLVLIIGGYGVYQQRHTASMPLVVEHVVQVTTPSGISPVPEFILKHRTELELSDEQGQRILTIATAYRKDISPYQQKLDAASADYQKKMERLPADKRHSIQELETEGSDVQQLSSIIVTTRHSYWQQARDVLTEKQQVQVDKLISKATLQDLQ